jgi:hypothetical protein
MKVNQFSANYLRRVVPAGVVLAGCKDPADRDVKASYPYALDPGIHAGTTVFENY